jgi:radial spoke head protein 1
MGDDEEDQEPKYELYPLGEDKPREDGSQKFTGQAKAKFLNGDVYDGTFVEGMRRGKGAYVFKKFGDVYEGHYEENRKSGFGKMTYKNLKSEDDEEEAEDEEEGKLPRGGSYVGNYTGGLRGCGPDEDVAATASDGTFNYANGDIYVGHWKAGKKHGIGTYTYAKDGTTLSGQWENGKIVTGKWTLPSGIFYCGKFRYNKPFGKGVWAFKDGNQVTGEYQQKEQPRDDEDAGEEEEEGAPPKPDPKVWCNFKPSSCVAVRGGTMF